MYLFIINTLNELQSMCLFIMNPKLNRFQSMYLIIINPTFKWISKYVAYLFIINPKLNRFQCMFLFNINPTLNRFQSIYLFIIKLHFLEHLDISICQQLVDHPIHQAILGLMHHGGHLTSRILQRIPRR